MRTGIVRDRDTAAHARTHIGGDLLHGIEFFRPRHGNTLVAVRVIDRQIDRNDRPAVLDSADLDRQPFAVDPRRPRYGRTRGDEQISRHHRFQQPESNLPAIGERHGLLHGGTDTVALGLAKVAPHRVETPVPGLDELTGEDRIGQRGGEQRHDVTAHLAHGLHGSLAGNGGFLTRGFRGLTAVHVAGGDLVGLLQQRHLLLLGRFLRLLFFQAAFQFLDAGLHLALFPRFTGGLLVETA